MNAVIQANRKSPWLPKPQQVVVENEAKRISEVLEKLRTMMAINTLTNPGCFNEGKFADMRTSISKELAETNHDMDVMKVILLQLGLLADAA